MSVGRIIVTGVVVALLQFAPAATLAKSAKKASAPAAPSLGQVRAAELLSRGRLARNEGRVIESLEYFQRAMRLSPTDGQRELGEVLQMLDGLRLQVLSGDRQSAGPGRAPRAPLQVQALLELTSDGGKRSIPARGVPVTWKWSTPTAGVLVGERETDANGRATFAVDTMPPDPEPKLEIAVDVSRLLPANGGLGSGPLLADATESLARRAATFSFIGQRAGAKNRILILIDETVLGDPASQSLISDRLTSEMVDAGMRIVGSTELGRSDYEKLRISFDPDQWVTLRPTLMKACDFVVWGKVDVRKDYVNEGGGMWCVGRGRVSLYGTYTPEIEASVDFSDVAEFSGDTWANCAERSLRKCAERTVQKLVPLVLRKTNQ